MDSMWTFPDEFKNSWSVTFPFDLSHQCFSFLDDDIDFHVAIRHVKMWSTYLRNQIFIIMFMGAYHCFLPMLVERTVHLQSMHSCLDISSDLSLSGLPATYYCNLSLPSYVLCILHISLFIITRWTVEFEIWSFHSLHYFSILLLLSSL